MDLLKYFLKPFSKRQKQYEAVISFFVDNLSAEDIALKYGYQTSTVYAIIRDAKKGKLELFPDVQRGPKQRTTLPLHQSSILELRKQNHSIHDIYEELLKANVHVSVKTIERILKDNGYEKLPRRSDKERGVTNKNKLIPEKSENINMSLIEPFSIDCPVAGVYFFLPYIIESGIIKILQKCKLPTSSVIGSVQACLSMLLLKLIGNERLSQIDGYDHEPGLGLFAGLNVLPKSTYMSTYSCLTSEKMVTELQKKIMTEFTKQNPEFLFKRFFSIMRDTMEI